MTTIGIIGAGTVGTQLARMAITAGNDVVLANTHGPDSLAGLVEELGPAASAATITDAASAGDLVIVAIPVSGFASLPAEAFVDKVVIDTGNYYPEYFGHIAELDSGTLTSSEFLQRELKGSHVVKAFSHLAVPDLTQAAQPETAEGRIALIVAGDDGDAKRIVENLIVSFGFDAVDAGPLKEGWRFGRDQPATGARLNAEDMRVALAEATRSV